MSTALGYISLLVRILSKYLDVPLMHEIKYRGSVSEVKDCSTCLIKPAAPIKYYGYDVNLFNSFPFFFLSESGTWVRSSYMLSLI